MGAAGYVPVHVRSLPPITHCLPLPVVQICIYIFVFEYFSRDWLAILATVCSLSREVLTLSVTYTRLRLGGAAQNLWLRVRACLCLVPSRAPPIRRRQTPCSRQLYSGAVFGWLRGWTMDVLLKSVCLSVCQSGLVWSCLVLSCRVLC